MLIFMSAKVGFKSCRLARECASFVHAWIITTQLEFCLHEQIQLLTNAVYRVGSQQFLSCIGS